MSIAYPEAILYGSDIITYMMWWLQFQFLSHFSLYLLMRMTHQLELLLL